MQPKTISQNQLSSECWAIQYGGANICLECDFKNTDECTGKRIIETGKNELGFNVPLGKENTI